MELVLEADGLTKKYGDQVSVNDLTLGVKRGEIYGFLGMNGAGKTTTIRMMLGLVHPDSGGVRLFGEGLSARNSHGLRRVGAIVEFPGFYENLTARENLEIHSALSGLADPRDVDEALALAGLSDDPKKKCGNYSLGMKQRLGLARALLHHPELVILDEPMNGLDPAGIRDVRNLLVSLSREHGITVFISSHILVEVEQIADRVGIVHEGRLIEEIAIADLRKKNREYVDFRVSDESKAAMLLESRMGITDFEIPENGTVRVYSRIEERAAANRLFVESGIDVSDVARSSTGLEAYFLGLTGGENA